MSEKITKEEYTTAVIALIRLAQQGTGGGRMAAQVLLSAYNGEAFQLDVAGLGNMDSGNHELAMIVIRGRYDTGCEPHSMVKDGDKIFSALWDRWIRLHVEERGKRECPDCDGRGKLFLNDDENDTRAKPCPRCAGKGRICGCGYTGPLATQGVKQAEWIPVTESKPDVDTTVLTFAPRSNEPVWPGYLDAEGDKDVWMDVSGAIMATGEVTHWMQFPDPPK